MRRTYTLFASLAIFCLLLPFTSLSQDFTGKEEIKGDANSTSNSKALILKINNKLQSELTNEIICAGDDAYYTGQVTSIPPGAWTYPSPRWTGTGAAYINDVNINGIVFNCNVPGDYTITFSATQGVTTYSITQTISVKAKDNLTLILPAGSPVNVCEATSVTFQASDAAQYYWLRDDGSATYPDLVGIGANSSETPPTIGTWDYRLYGESAGGCPTNPEYYDFQIIVEEAATADAGGPYSTCSGVGVALSGSIGGSASSAEWVGGAGTFAPDRFTLNATYTPHASEAGSDVTLILRTDDPAGVCSFVESSATVTVYNLPSGSITAQTNVSCFGGNNGEVTITGSGDGAPFEYSLDGGAYQVSGTFSGLSAGPYTVTVRNANLCTFNVPVTITQPATSVGGSISSQTNVLCFGASTGSVTVAGSGGTSPYQYSLDGGAFQASGTFNGLAAGPYTVTVRDALLCTINVPVTITQPALAVSGSITSQTNVLCFGSSTGSVTILGSGGVGPYQYSLNGGTFQGSGTFNGLAAGPHSITVRDANLCTSSVPITITQPASAVSGSITSQTNVLCFGGSTGSVTVAGSGGTPGYQYSLNGGAYQGSGTFSGLSAGPYTVSVRDANLCTFNVAVSITQPASSVGGSITSQTNVSCFGGNNGSVTVAGSGGTSPYEYSLDGGPYQGSGTFSGLSAGPNTVTVRDANLCTFNVAVTITQPAVSVSGSISSQTNVLCFGSSTGSVTVAGSGGTSPYQYSLNGGAFQASGTFNGLAAGPHTVTVRDALLCTFNVPVTITQPASAVSGSITSQTNVLCFGSSTGSVTILGSGGVGPYQYSLNGGAFQGSGTFNGLAAGPHSVTVRDANLCTSSVPITITQPASAVGGLISSQTNVSCFGGNDGEVTIAGSGGTPGYQYSLNGGVYQGSGTFSGLAAGPYTVTVRDANLCTFNVAVSITQPASGVGGTITSQTNVSCFGGNNGSVTITGNGGTSPYEYSLDGGAFQGSGTFSSLSAGPYTVTVRDANLCTFNVAITITQPATGVGGSITSQTNVSCSGGSDGSATAAGSGGTPPYQYSLDGGAFQGSGTFFGLNTDPHTITVRDALLCTFDINFTLTAPDPIAIDYYNVTSIVDMNGCFGQAIGSIEVLAEGGTPNYSYSLYRGATFVGTQSPVHPAPAVFSGLIAANDYRIEVTDASACPPAQETDIVLIQPDLLAFTYTKENLTCYGNLSGEIHFTPTGGTPAYQYSINNGVTWGNNPDIVGLAAGIYRLKVKDANGCVTATQNVTITQPTQITSDGGTWTNVTSCNGDQTGSITVNASGGTAPYTFTLNPLGTVINNPTTGVFTNLFAGSYTVDIEDATGCSILVGPIIITQPDEIDAFADILNVTGCWYNTNGELFIWATGGTDPLEYSIDNGATWQDNPSFENLGVGTYNIIVRDANGCEFFFTETITGPPAIVISDIDITNVLCFGGATGEIVITASGGTGVLQYSINGGAYQASNTFTNLTANTYTVRVRDGNSCVLTQDVEVTEPAPLLFITQEATDITCNGLVDGTITLEVSGGTAPYNYSITGTPPFTSTDGLYTGLSAGNYPVVVRDANGCITFGSTLVITEPAVIAITGEVSQDILCFGETASITITATGGTGALTYTLMPGSVLNTTGVFTGIAEGTYTVEVDDENGCGPVVSSIFTFTEPDAITIDPLAITVTQITCFGNTDGEIAVTATGGTGDLEYTLIESGVPVTTQTNNGTFTLLPAGSYTVSVTDDNNCGPVVVGPFDIASPAELTLSTEVVNVSCSFSGNDGTIRATGNGGTAPYHIILLLGGVQQADFTNVAEGVEVEFTGLAGAPNYEVEIRDANFPTCPAVLSGLLNLIVPDELTIGAPVILNPSCIGQADATITIQAAGGTLSYTYTLFDSGNTQIGAPIVSATADPVEFNGISAGTYYITVDDNNGCGPVATANFNINDPAPIVFTAFKTDMDCFGFGVGTGEIFFNITSGGTAPFEYSVDGGTNFSLVNPVTGLLGGDYVAMVRDANGCLSGTQNINIFEPDELTLTLEGFDVSCNGDSDGRIIATSTGGTSSIVSPKRFKLNSGLWQTSNVFNDVPAGTHTVTVIDAKNCETVETIVIGEPDAITILTVDYTDPTCTAPGTIAVTAEGGTSPLSYTLQPGGAVNATGIFTNLGGNTYTVEVSDINGCGPVVTAPITLTSPSLISLDDVIVTDATGCFGTAANGEIEIIATGGTGTLTYSIDGGITTSLSNIFSDLEPGDYIVVVNDDADCPQVMPVTVNGPAEITYNILVEDEEQPTGAANGVIFVEGFGGTGLLSFNLWENTAGFITSNATGLFENLSNGTYWVVITDENGCSVTTRLIPLAGLLVIPTVTNVDCNGNSTGAIDLAISGGTPPYTITWAGPSGALPAFNDMEDISGLVAGTYTVHVEDIDGLFIDLDIDVTEPVAISLPTQIADSPNCHPSQGGTNDGSITVSATGGTPPYTYYLEDSNGLPVDNNITGEFTALWAGLYQIEVIDANGCTFNTAIDLVEPVALSYETPIFVWHPSNHTATDGQIIVVAQGGGGGYTYTLLPSNISNGTGIFTDLTSGIYQVVIEDSNGCSLTTEEIQLFGITVVLEPNHISCFGANDGWINLLTSDLLEPYTITLFWVEGNEYITGGLSADSKILTPGNYIVTVTSGGNIVSAQTEILEPTQIVANILQVENPGCFGAETGFVIFDITGGTPFADGYDISWDGGSSRGFVAQPLGAGSYNFTITDANGCSFAVPDMVVITAPAAMELVSLDAFNLSCHPDNTLSGLPSGAISVLLSGGAEPITYTVTGPITSSNITGIFTGLPAGEYTLSAEDANGCTFDFGASNTVTLTQPEPILITTLTPITVPLLCWDTQGEDVNMQVSGGTPDYVYQWYKWSVTADGYDPYQPSLNLVAPTPGYYQFVVTDGEGCIASKYVDIPGPTEYHFNYSTQEAICRNSDDDEGEITINYVFWDFIPTGNVIFTPGAPENQLHISWDHSDELDDVWALTGLTSGNYSAVITDENGCTDTFSTTISYPETNQFDLNITKFDPVCHNETGTIIASTSQTTGIPPLEITMPFPVDSIAWYKVTPVEEGDDILEYVFKGNTYTINNVTSQLVHKVVAVSYAGCKEELFDTLRVYPRIRPYVDPQLHPFFSADTSAFRDTTVISILTDTEYDMLVETYLNSPSYFGVYPSEFFNPYISFDEESEEEPIGQLSFSTKFRFNTGLFEPYLTGTMLNYNTGVNERYIPIKIYAETEFGCTDSLELKARILNKIKIPNVFTPNGDGVNDTWIVPYGSLFPEIEVYVYNRWGYTIWEGKGSEAHKGWDGNNSNGTPYPVGTYYYVVKFNVANKSSWKNLSGSITILR